jgi:hypothetical protein
MLLVLMRWIERSILLKKKDRRLSCLTKTKTISTYALIVVARLVNHTMQDATSNGALHAGINDYRAVVVKQWPGGEFGLE